MKGREVHEAIEQIILKRNPQIKKEQLLWRADQRLEITCDHGVGHTVFSPRGFKDFVHGCCGCCANFVAIELNFKLPKNIKDRRSSSKKPLSKSEEAVRNP